MSIISTVSNFVEHVRSAENDIQASTSDIEERIQSLGTFLQTLGAAHTRQNDHNLAGLPKELADMLRPHFEQRAHALREWAHVVDDEVRAEEFVREFDRSLVVVVLGKVNSGKTTLGNALAGSIFRNHPKSPYLGNGPVFRRHDGRADHVVARLGTGGTGDEWNTGPTECTNGIQSFTLGGLTWVDTPGIGSMTAENQDLAKRYVHAAEMVFFVTSSDSPMRRGDVTEQEEIGIENKESMIVVSKFDKFEEDIDPDTGDFVRALVVKSKTSRDEQLTHIRSELEGLDVDSTALFLSVEYANQAVARDDEDAFIASGMPALFEKISVVLSEDAVRLKREAPRNRFNARIATIIGDGLERTQSFERLLFRLNQLEETRALKESELLDSAKAIENTFMSAAIDRITRSVHELEDMQLKGLAAERKKKRKELAEALDEDFQKAIAKHVEPVLDDFDKAMMKDLRQFAIDIPKLKTRMRKVIHSRTKFGEGVGKALGGVLAASGLAAGVFLLVGTPVGWGALAVGAVELVATAVGAEAGGKIGREVGKRNAKIETTAVGTNADQVIAEIEQELRNSSVPAVRHGLQKIRDNYFSVFQNMIDGEKRVLIDAREKIRGLKYEGDVGC